MKIWLNGERVDVPAVNSIAELAASYGLHANSILIEHNGVAVRPREWTEQKLREDDRIEFVRVVAGG